RRGDDEQDRREPKTAHPGSLLGSECVGESPSVPDGWALRPGPAGRYFPKRPLSAPLNACSSPPLLATASSAEAVSAESILAAASWGETPPPAPMPVSVTSGSGSSARAPRTST